MLPLENANLYDQRRMIDSVPPSQRVYFDDSAPISDRAVVNSRPQAAGSAGASSGGTTPNIIRQGATTLVVVLVLMIVLGFFFKRDKRRVDSSNRLVGFPFAEVPGGSIWGQSPIYYRGPAPARCVEPVGAGWGPAWVG